MSKELEVRNLQISFWTNNGTVKAVRDISFDLEKGETLCIVGESGSGKSVTAKAIMGILAGNSIVEGGEIIYQGSDLLKYTERDFDKIRGNKITMIFQDPLSSLDPIVKIGKQMTEATLLNGKTNCAYAKKQFRRYLRLLEKNMPAAGCGDAAKERLKKFEQLTQEISKRQYSYVVAKEYTESLVMSLEQLHIELHSNDEKTIKSQMKEVEEKLPRIYNELWITQENTSIQEPISTLSAMMKEWNGSDREKLQKQILLVTELLEEELKREDPDFFALGYETVFLQEFLSDLAKVLSYTRTQVIPAKEKTVASLRLALPFFEHETIDEVECGKTVKELTALVRESIDPLSLQTNSFATTFATTMDKAMKRYFHKDKMSAEVDPALTKKTMEIAIKRLADAYEQELAQEKQIDDKAPALAMAKQLHSYAFDMNNKVTHQMAYDKAIRIMEDVGIKESRKRFNQYPFEFSGGMRQRIVIAIAIAANPDILICDEPTTALDVTIQAQIMELINEVKRKRQISVIFITHDLGVVANMADKVAVMYAGKIVEYGTTDDIFYQPAHPYTWALLASMPDLDTKEKLEAIPGTPPNMIFPPVGDAFAERNQYAMQIDFEKQPPLFRISDTHYAATWLLHPNAPKVDPPKSVTDRIKRMKELEASYDKE
jgi:oligopeptide/dipeptide ABC transporter ATP-binding protein